MLAQRYSKDKLNTKIERICFCCKGSRVYCDNVNEEESCIICKGQGKIEVELELCPECNEVIPADNKMWVNDNYGVPYKKVCFDCVDKTKKEIGNWKFNSSYAGEDLNSVY